MPIAEFVTCFLLSGVFSWFAETPFSCKLCNASKQASTALSTG